MICFARNRILGSAHAQRVILFSMVAIISPLLPFKPSGFHLQATHTVNAMFRQITYVLVLIVIRLPLADTE